MDEFDSGGRGSDKGLEAEDEGSTTPLPEKVSVICLSWKKMLGVSSYAALYEMLLRCFGFYEVREFITLVGGNEGWGKC